MSGPTFDKTGHCEHGVYRDYYCKACEINRVREIEQQLAALRYAMKKIATGEHSNPALAAKRALKERDNE